jgi:hypothetical protein
LLYTRCPQGEAPRRLISASLFRDAVDGRQEYKFDKCSTGPTGEDSDSAKGSNEPRVDLRALPWNSSEDWDSQSLHNLGWSPERRIEIIQNERESNAHEDGDKQPNRHD